MSYENEHESFEAQCKGDERRERLDSFVADWSCSKKASEAFGIKSRVDICYLNAKKLMTTPVWTHLDRRYVEFGNQGPQERNGDWFQVDYELTKLKKQMLHSDDFEESDVKEWFKGSNGATPVIARELQLAHPDIAWLIVTKRCPIGRVLYPDHPFDREPMDDTGNDGIDPVSASV